MEKKEDLSDFELDVFVRGRQSTRVSQTAAGLLGIFAVVQRSLGLTEFFCSQKKRSCFGCHRKSKQQVKEAVTAKFCVSC